MTNTTDTKSTSTLTSWITGVFAGSLIANGLPHLFFALTGQTHATPFGADSSITVNLIWALFNLAAGLALALPARFRRHPVPYGIAAASGAIGTAISLILMWA